MTKFAELNIGDTFDFVGGAYPSFYKRCTKVSPRMYACDDGIKYRVGSIYCKVYNVSPKTIALYAIFEEHFK